MLHEVLAKKKGIPISLSVAGTWSVPGDLRRSGQRWLAAVASCATPWPTCHGTCSSEFPRERAIRSAQAWVALAARGVLRKARLR